MPAVHQCPADAILRDFLAGSYAGPDGESLSVHLLACPACGSRAERFAAHDSLSADLRSAFDTGDIASDGTFVEEMLRRLPSPPTGVSVADADLAFLALPRPEFPDDLGMLDRYRIVRLIGEGGMGRVFEAFDPHLDRTIALKVILPKYAGNAKLRSRFLDEARATVKCRSPRVAEVYEAGVWNDVPYLTMELLSGTTLAELPKPLPVAAWVPIARDIARGLADAHAVDMIHRDLKPGNVHLGTSRTGERTVKLIDFGLARPVDRDIALTQPGEILGTPAYMSPEQARGGKVDHRTDLYSLGVILFQLAAGKLPYDADGGVFGILAQLATTEPLPSVRTHVPNLAPELAAVIDGLLAKDPAHRLGTAEAVVKALSASPAEVVAEPTTQVFIADPPPAPRRRPWWPVGVALALGLAGLGLAAGGLPWIKKPEPGENADVGKPTPPPPAPTPIVTIGTHDRRTRGGIFDVATAPALGLAVTLGRLDGVKLWDTGTLKLKAAAPPATFGDGPPLFGAILNAEWIAGLAYPGKLYLLKVVADKIELHHTYDIPLDIPIEGYSHQLGASPDGNWLALHLGNKVYIWSREQLQQRQPASTVLNGYEFYPDNLDLYHPFLRFADDSKSLGVVTRAGVRLAALVTGGWKETAVVPAPDFVGSFVFDAAGKNVFLTSAKFPSPDPGQRHLAQATLQQWSVADGKAVRVATVASSAHTLPGRIERNADTLVVLGELGGGVATFSDRDGLKAFQHYPYAFAGSDSSYLRLTADGEILAFGGVLRKYRLKGKNVMEVDPEPFDHNVWEAEDRSLFGRFGSRVLVVGREAGSPVRVWELNVGKAEMVFERKSKVPQADSQRAVLSPNGREVLISETDHPPVVWGIDAEGRQTANTTFGTAAWRHEPFGLTADGKYALMYQLEGGFLTVWQRDQLDSPIAKYKAEPPAGDGYRGIRVFTVKNGWRVCFLGDSNNANIVDPVDIQLTGPTPTFSKGTRIHSGFSVRVRENFTLSTRALGPNGAQMHWVLEDRSRKPNVETVIPFPADFQTPAGIALSPNGNILLAYDGRTGRVILFDRTTKKTVWDHQFTGGIRTLDFVEDETHLMVVYADGVVEIVDTTSVSKKEEKK